MTKRKNYNTTTYKIINRWIFFYYYRVVLHTCFIKLFKDELFVKIRVISRQDVADDSKGTFQPAH